MRIRWIALLAVLAILAVACDGDDPELTTDSTIVTGATSEAAPGDGSTTTIASGDGGEGETSPSTTLVGQQVTEYDVVNEIPNEDGVTQIIVIPEGAYTDIDLENFVIDLLEANPDLYGAEIFDSAAAAEAFLVPEADHTEEQTELLANDWFVTLTGRASITFRGPFSEFPGGAIGS